MDAAAQDAIARADWRHVRNLYQQVMSILNDPEKENVLPDIVTGALAESLSRVLAFYEDQETQFMEDVFSIWSDLEALKGSKLDRFRRLYFDERYNRFPAYNPPGAQRRRPTPFETAIETPRRLYDLNRVRDAFANLPTAGILGGSLSYGRFFNVCGASRGKPSDTDLLLVIPDYSSLGAVADALGSVAGLDNQSLEEFKARIKLFPDILETFPNSILSHKLKFWEDTPHPYLSGYKISADYLLSVHVFSLQMFDFLILKDVPIIQGDRDGRFLRELTDYRNTSPERKDNQRAFNGVDYTIELDKVEVPGGYVNRVLVCHILANRFYPGLHQNLVLPQFEIRWESPAVRLYLRLLGFRWKALARLHEERMAYPFEVRNLSLSHTRSAVFSPHITQRANRE